MSLDDEQEYSEPKLDPNYMQYIRGEAEGPTGVAGSLLGSLLGLSPDEPAPYGQDLKGKPLYGPVSYEQHFPSWDLINKSTLQADWNEERVYLDRKGFEFVKPLGKGAYGEVWKVIDRNNNRELAAKVIDIKSYFKEESPEKAINSLLKEIDILVQLKHQNIIAIEAIFHRHHKETGFPIICSFVFMELMEESLHNMIEKIGKLDENKSFEWFIQIAEAIRYLHQKNVCHLDIKPENILYKSDQNSQIVYKLCDFGLSKIFAPTELATGNQFKGTQDYMPPEVLSMWNKFRYLFNFPANTYLTKPFDIYSLGITLGHSVFGYLADENEPIEDWIHYSFQDIGFGPNSPVYNLISKMTESDPQKRITINEILNHQWIQLNSNLN